MKRIFLHVFPISDKWSRKENLVDSRHWSAGDAVLFLFFLHFTAFPSSTHFFVVTSRSLNMDCSMLSSFVPMFTLLVAREMEKGTHLSGAPGGYGWQMWNERWKKGTWIKERERTKWRWIFKRWSAWKRFKPDWASPFSCTYLCDWSKFNGKKRSEKKRNKRKRRGFSSGKDIVVEFQSKGLHGSNEKKC